MLAAWTQWARQAAAANEWGESWLWSPGLPRVRRLARGDGRSGGPGGAGLDASSGFVTLPEAGRADIKEGFDLDGPAEIGTVLEQVVQRLCAAGAEQREPVEAEGPVRLPGGRGPGILRGRPLGSPSQYRRGESDHCQGNR